MKAYSKFFAALIPAIGMLLPAVGVVVSPGILEGAVVILTPAAVYALPNG